VARIRDNADSSVAQSASVCEIEGCGDPVHRRRWCRHHYQVWQRSGDPLKGKRQRPSIRTYCSIEGCVRISNSRGWCDRHYYAWYRTGDPLSTDKRRKPFDRVKYDIRCENAIAKGVTHTCTMCGGTKPVQEFVKSRTRRDGFTNRCLKCTRSLDKDRPKRIRTTRKASWPLAPIPKSRECESCHRVLPIEQFTKNSEYSFGRTYECKKFNNKNAAKFGPNFHQRSLRNARQHHSGGTKQIWTRQDPLLGIEEPGFVIARGVTLLMILRESTSCSEEGARYAGSPSEIDIPLTISSPYQARAIMAHRIYNWFIKNVILRRDRKTL
jgi:hypothetical protein